MKKIKLTQVGYNLTLTVGTKTFTKAIKDKIVRDSIKEQIKEVQVLEEKQNSTPTKVDETKLEKALSKIQTIFTANIVKAEKAKVEKKIIAKKVEKKIKKEIKKESKSSKSKLPSKVITDKLTSLKNDIKDLSEEQKNELRKLLAVKTEAPTTVTAPVERRRSGEY